MKALTIEEIMEKYGDNPYILLTFATARPRGLPKYIRRYEDKLLNYWLRVTFSAYWKNRNKVYNSVDEYIWWVGDVWDMFEAEVMPTLTVEDMADILISTPKLK